MDGIPRVAQDDDAVNYTEMGGYEAAGDRDQD